MSLLGRGRALDIAVLFGKKGTLGVFANGIDEYLTVADHASIQNIFASGGSWYWEGVISGFTTLGILLDKARVQLQVRFTSGNTCKVRFVKLFTDSGTITATWTSTNFLIEFDKPVGILVNYNASDIANNPTITVIQDNTVTVLTVGSGLVEDTAPSGVSLADASFNPHIMSLVGGGFYLNGVAHQSAMFTTASISVTSLKQNLLGLSPVAYWRMGNDPRDYINAGGGVIYDASTNDNNATTVNMDSSNLVKV